MADFRRISVLVALVMIIAGTASAQLPINTQACTANAAVPPTVRSEGYTELVGDIVLQCTGGTPTPRTATAQVPSNVIPQANFTVFLNTAITSRLYSNSASQNASEALLLVDEPNTSANPSGLLECTTPFSGCSMTGAGVVDGSGNITAGTLPGAAISGPYTGQTGRPNVYRGIVSGNQVQFIGVPVDAPGTAGIRVYRFTNIRVNANGISSGPSGTPGTIQALLSVTGNTSLPINNPTQIVGYVQPGMSFTPRARGDITSTPNQNTNIGFAQCSSLSRTTTTGYYILQFTEGFPSAFKVRGTSAQNQPGRIYNTESGFSDATALTNSTFTGSASTGYADYGTRFKAVFSNIPAGVNVYVSTSAYPGTYTGANAQAVLVGSESGTRFDVPAGWTDFGTQSSGQGVISAGTNNSGAQISVVNGSATAVWEVINHNPLQTESYNVLVWFNYTQAAASNSPPAGTATVAGSFAPTPSALGASTTAAATASATLPIPRFVDTTTGSRSIFAIYLCRTNLLFPYVTNAAGFDTGLAIANTSLDTGLFLQSTTTQQGACTLFQFGDNSNPSKASPTIQAGKVWATLASDSSWFQANFTGYVIAQCAFQYAHGFAFVSDFGARNLAMGYLALIIPEPGNGTRSAGTAGEALDN